MNPKRGHSSGSRRGGPKHQSADHRRVLNPTPLDSTQLREKVGELQKLKALSMQQSVCSPRSTRAGYSSSSSSDSDRESHGRRATGSANSHRYNPPTTHSARDRTQPAFSASSPHFQRPGVEMRTLAVLEGPNSTTSTALTTSTTSTELGSRGTTPSGARHLATFAAGPEQQQPQGDRSSTATATSGAPMVNTVESSDKPGSLMASQQAMPAVRVSRLDDSEHPGSPTGSEFMDATPYMTRRLATVREEDGAVSPRSYHSGHSGYSYDNYSESSSATLMPRNSAGSSYAGTDDTLSFHSGYSGFSALSGLSNNSGMALQTTPSSSQGQFPRTLRQYPPSLCSTASDCLPPRPLHHLRQKRLTVDDFASLLIDKLNNYLLTVEAENEIEDISSVDISPAEERLPPLFVEPSDPGDEGDDERSLKSSHMSEVISGPPGCAWLEEEESSSARTRALHAGGSGASVASSLSFLNTKLKTSQSTASLDSGFASTCSAEQRVKSILGTLNLPASVDIRELNNEVFLKRAVYRTQNSCGVNEMDSAAVWDLVRTKYAEILNEEVFAAKCRQLSQNGGAQAPAPHNQKQQPQLQQQQQQQAARSPGHTDTASTHTLTPSTHTLTTSSTHGVSPSSHSTSSSSSRRSHGSSSNRTPDHSSGGSTTRRHDSRSLPSASSGAAASSSNSSSKGTKVYLVVFVKGQKEHLTIACRHIPKDVVTLGDVRKAFRFGENTVVHIKAPSQDSSGRNALQHFHDPQSILPKIKGDVQGRVIFPSYPKSGLQPTA